MTAECLFRGEHTTVITHHSVVAAVVVVVVAGQARWAPGCVSADQ